jgi:hypothetical protein
VRKSPQVSEVLPLLYLDVLSTSDFAPALEQFLGIRGRACRHHQRCWWHKISNVLAALPKSAHPGAKKALAEI